jgi:hypothetical protein
MSFICFSPSISIPSRVLNDSVFLEDFQLLSRCFNKLSICWVDVEVGKDFLIAVGSPFLQKIYQLLVKSPYSSKLSSAKGFAL